MMKLKKQIILNNRMLAYLKQDYKRIQLKNGFLKASKYSKIPIWVKLDMVKLLIDAYDIHKNQLIKLLNDNKKIVMLKTNKVIDLQMY